MRHVGGSRASLWLSWALFVAALALELALAYRVSGRPDPWHAGQTAVAGFVLALIATALGVWTFALRESLAMRDLRAGRLDPATPEGISRLHQMLLVLWFVCLLVGLIGSVVAWGSASPTASWPYLAGAAALLAVHAPSERLLTGPPR
jgi:hypothetical protein